MRLVVDQQYGPATLQHNAADLINAMSLDSRAASVIELKELPEASLKPDVKLILEKDSLGILDYSSLPPQPLNLLDARDPTMAYPFMSLLSALDHTDAEGRLNAI